MDLSHGSETLRVLDLLSRFERINGDHFDGFLTPPILRWNARLRASAGRFIPGSRRFWQDRPAVIEVASYLKEEAEADRHVSDTLAHEMIHYWLWVRRRPYGHTVQFYEKMRAMGVSRYNPVPRLRPAKYIYRCLGCTRDFPARRRLARSLACADCCRVHAQGEYDPRFRLELVRQLR